MERYPKTLWKFLENQDLGLAERLEVAIKLVKEVKRAHEGYVAHRDIFVKQGTLFFIDIWTLFTVMNKNFFRTSFATDRTAPIKSAIAFFSNNFCSFNNFISTFSTQMIT